MNEFIVWIDHFKKWEFQWHSLWHGRNGFLNFLVEDYQKDESMWKGNCFNWHGKLHDKIINSNKSKDN